MGAIGSKVEVVDDEAGTPVKCEFTRRQLDEDPRSPTANIPRTPIIVDKTPDGLLDPRSPTPGIWRTPINSFIKKQDEVTIEREDVRPLLDNPSSDSLLPPVTENARISHKIDPPAILTDLEHLSLSDVDESSNLITNVNSVNHRKPKSQKTQPKKLFYDKKRPLKNITRGSRSVVASMTPPRSPLSTVVIDTNSPHAIIQRKQTKKIDAARQCRIEATRTVLDKENVDM